MPHVTLHVIHMACVWKGSCVYFKLSISPTIEYLSDIPNWSMHTYTTAYRNSTLHFAGPLSMTSISTFPTTIQNHFACEGRIHPFFSSDDERFMTHVE